jgi:MoaA/NifB/PqqE/SkfB family radical SAM enzyme
MAGVRHRFYRKLYTGTNYRLRSFAGGRLAQYCRPSEIMFLLTERCNAKCVHCDIWKNKGGEDSPGFAGWSRVLRDLRTWLGPVNLVFTGGEALLRPYTPSLAAYASRLGLSLEVLTHGYWEDQSRIEQLALAGPARITLSVDGTGETHSKIRGREDFFEKTNRSIETLVRIREQHGLAYRIRLKTVVMEHNLHNVGDVARYASRPGMEVYYQPIEQNYNTPQDENWFLSSENWPADPERAVRAVEQLIRLKEEGLHIANTAAQLEAMIHYFRDASALRLVTQAHLAHLRNPFCASLTMLQLQSNGDVTTCSQRRPVGNVKDAPVRQIWESRPAHWEKGCCLSGYSEDLGSESDLNRLDGALPILQNRPEPGGTTGVRSSL